MTTSGWVLTGTDHNTVNALSRKLLILNIPWTVFLSTLAILPSILIYSFNLPFYLGGSNLLPSVAIILDILDRFNVLRKSNSGKLVKIAELHDLYDASMIKQHMKSEGVICHFQGYYHRHLLYFFGPYIDISIMVPESDREPGEELIRRYYNGLGLLRS